MISPAFHRSNPAVTEPDRRLHPRYSVNVQVEVRQDGCDVPMRSKTTDFSRGGFYIQLMIPLSVGICLQATLWIDGCPVVVRGLVATASCSWNSKETEKNSCVDT